MIIGNFTYANVGDNSVTLTLSDQNNNSGSKVATVTVVDAVKPTVATQNISVQLDASGTASINTSQIENGSTDNCSIASSSLDITSFTCADIGENTVTLSVTDQSNNTGTATAIVLVEDLIKPTVIGKDITRDLNGAASVTIIAADVDNGSSDNCNFSLSIDTDTFSVAGIYPVLLTITDGSGNSNTVSVTVTITGSTHGIEDSDMLLKDVKIYPNSVESTLFISTELNINRVEIYDLLGKRTNIIEGHPTAINTLKMSKGIYFLKIYSDDRSIIKRFIKK